MIPLKNFYFTKPWLLIYLEEDILEINPRKYKKKKHQEVQITEIESDTNRKEMPNNATKHKNFNISTKLQ